MRVHVLGKQFVSGKSKKTGKDFAANVVDVCFQRNGVEGYATDRIWLDPKEYPLDNIVLDKDYTVDELEAKVKAGEQISLVDLAEAIKADKERGKEKPSIRAQLKADKERTGKKKNAKQKSQDLERS